MRTGVILLLILVSIGLKAQVFNPLTAKPYEQVSFYNSGNIRKQGLKSMMGYYSTKAQLDIIRKKEEVSYYEFNRKGLLIREYHTKFGDTTFYSYAYDYKSRLLKMRRSGNAGNHIYSYTYDDRDRMLSREHQKSMVKTDYPYTFELEKSDRVRLEKFKYSDFDGLNYKKEYLNDAGKVYRQEFFYFGEKYLSETESRTVNGSGRSKTEYTFNKKGLLITLKTFKKLINSIRKKYEYEYDRQGNLLAMKLYKNGKYLTERQIVYKEETALLKAIIERKEQDNFMTILRFQDHRFFPE